MKISIAMATWNGATYLEDQLQSLVAQSRLPDELVVVDDQSNDATADLVRAFASRAPFKVLLEVNPRRLGPTQNFDRAIGICTGDLVLLSDQDDVWLPEKIATLEGAARQSPDKGCIINDALMTNASLEPAGTTKMGQVRAAGLPATAMVQGCCASFRRNLLNCLLPIPSDQQAHDSWLVQMADLLDQTVRLDVPLQYYRRHGQNVSNCDANRIEEPGYWQRLKEGFSGTIRRASDSDGLDRELEFHTAAVKRLTTKHTAFLAVVGAQRLDGAVDVASRYSQILVNRKSIRSLPRRHRLPEIWRLWHEGGYMQSGRAAGAAKDLLVTRQAMRGAT